jgi:hypothetical protein
LSLELVRTDMPRRQVHEVVLLKEVVLHVLKGQR